MTIRVHEAGELGGVGGVGPPVGGVEVEVLRAFGELPTDFLFSQPPLVFRGRTNADGEVTFDAVAGRGYPTPQLVTVRLPEGWTSAEQPATDLARWRRAATAERAVIEILGLPDGTVSGPAGAAATMTVRVIRSPGSTVETASSPAVVE
ncbi:MAG TPA: hypothetical protein VNY84_10330, partial [Acidimicrobiales bacterium]|nr:hypothetical protein [Acidimicrobiales bacterium]